MRGLHSRPIHDHTAMRYVIYQHRNRPRQCQHCGTAWSQWRRRSRPSTHRGGPHRYSPSDRAGNTGDLTSGRLGCLFQSCKRLVRLGLPTPQHAPRVKEKPRRFRQLRSANGARIIVGTLLALLLVTPGLLTTLQFMAAAAHLIGRRTFWRPPSRTR